MFRTYRRFPRRADAQRLGGILGFAALCALAAAALALATPEGASAAGLKGNVALHAEPTHADPGYGAVLKSAPSQITMQFGEDLTPSGSGMTVYDDHGKVVSGTASVSPSDPKTMTASMQGNDSETYVVYFHTVSAGDGDAFTDAYQFTVSKDATASPGTQPGATTPSATASSGVSPLIAALIGLLALIVGAAAGFLFAERRTTPASPSSGTGPGGV